MGNRYSDVDEDYPIIQSCGYGYFEYYYIWPRHRRLLPYVARLQAKSRKHVRLLANRT